MRFRPGRPLALLVALAAPAVLPAQGFGLNEIGTCAVARVAATTGAPCDDASVIFWNPAAGTRLKGLSMYAGITLIDIAGDFTADTTGRVSSANVSPEFPPHLFINWNRGGRYALGLGVYVPYGLTSQWRDDFPGRFSAKRAAVATLYVQPNISFNLTPSWSIGGGPVIGRSDVELEQGLDLSQQPLPGGASGQTLASLGIAPGTEFGRAMLQGSAMAYGFHVGVHGRVGTNFQIGARYLSALNFEYDDADAEFLQLPTGLVIADPTLAAQLGVPAGTPWDVVVRPNFQGTGALTAQKVSTKLRHPAQLQVGLGFTAPMGTLLSLDGAFIQWSVFDELPVNFQGSARANSRALIEDYDDSFSIRGSAEHRFGTVAIRGGISFVQTPAPDVTVTPLLPDQDRMNYGIGLGVPFTLGARGFVFDASYLLVDTEGRRGRIAERTARSQTATQLNNGFYRLTANIASISLKAQF